VLEPINLNYIDHRDNRKLIKTVEATQYRPKKGEYLNIDNVGHKITSVDEVMDAEGVLQYIRVNLNEPSFVIA